MKGYREKEIAAMMGAAWAEPATAAGERAMMHTPSTRWRIYFNRHGDANLPWCIAPDSRAWEIAVRSWSIKVESEETSHPTVMAAAHGTYVKKATADDDDGVPSAWISVRGTLSVSTDGDAVISCEDYQGR